MTNHEHERAIELITRRGVENIATPEASWLESHLATCTGCAEYAALADDTGRLLRSVAVTASPALVSTTQARLRARALEMRERESRMFLIGVSFCLGVLSSTASAWLWWRFGGWVAQLLGLPESIVGPGVLVFWLLPAIAIAVVLTFVPRTVFNNPLMLALAREREGEIR
jgi:anti-sigma factor RsiW